MIKIFRIALVAFASAFFVGANAQSEGQSSNIATNPSFEDFKVLDMNMPRPDDVMWSKVLWRMIDLREKVNHPLYYPTIPADGRMSLFTFMFNLIKDGKINAYEYNADYEDFSEKSKISFEKICDPTMLDVLYDIKTDENGDSIGVEVNPVDIPTSQILKFYVKEVWYFDKKESTMKVRILGLCPQRYWEDFELGTQQKSALFWVSYDEIRPYLAVQNIVVNDYNNSQRETFDDLFVKRHFSSYIYKESNIYNRTLTDYCNSVEEVHAEQERIANEIRNYEQDLWEY